MYLSADATPLYQLNWDILDNAYIQAIILAVVLPLLAALYAWLSPRFREFLQFQQSQWWFWGAIKWRRLNQKCVTLDLYVEILEHFRESLIRRYARNGPTPTLYVHAITRQLPRHWPLWGIDLTDVAGRTPLEEYFSGFHQFITTETSRKHNYKVSVQRTIVIDNCNGTTGEERLRQLKEDASLSSINTYIERLHCTPNDAFYCLYPRPWPNWLSDVVFYGVQLDNSDLTWIYAIATSYDAGEDLILLRLYKLKRRTQVPKHLILPNQIKVLEDLAELPEMVTPPGKVYRLADLMPLNDASQQLPIDQREDMTP